MLSHLVLVLGVLALGVVLVLSLRSVWRARRVDFIHRLSIGPDADEVAALMFDRIVPVPVDDGYCSKINADFLVGVADDEAADLASAG